MYHRAAQRNFSLTARTMTNTTRLLTFALTALALSACAGDDSADDTPGQAPAARGDTIVRPIKRQPLGAADLAGISRDAISLELPWTANRVARDRGSAPRAAIASVSSDSHDGFDRVILSFEGSVAVPGYDVSFADSGAELPCGDGPQSATLASERLLVIRTGPSRAEREDGSRTMRTRTERMGHARLAEGGLVCDSNDVTLWVAGLTEGSEVRVFELRDPLRLVVDVR